MICPIQLDKNLTCYPSVDRSDEHTSGFSNVLLGDNGRLIKSMRQTFTRMGDLNVRKTVLFSPVVQKTFDFSKQTSSARRDTGQASTRIQMRSENFNEFKVRSSADFSAVLSEASKRRSMNPVSRLVQKAISSKFRHAVGGNETARGKT